MCDALLLRGAIVIRTPDVHKNPYIPLFVRTILGPDYCVPRNSPREDARIAVTVGSSPPEVGMRIALGPSEEGRIVETVVSTCSSPPEPGVRRTPGPREDARIATTVGSFPAKLGTRIVLGPREDGRTSAAVASPPREPDGRHALGLRVEDISRNISRASSTISSLEAPTTSRSDSQDTSVALRCGYGNTGPSRSFRALRSRSSREIGRNLPLYTINECRNIVTSGLHPDPCEARDSSSAPGASPAANEPVEDTPRPQDLAEATPLVPICAPLVQTSHDEVI